MVVIVPCHSKHLAQDTPSMHDRPSAVLGADRPGASVALHAPNGFQTHRSLPAWPWKPPGPHQIPEFLWSQEPPVSAAR